MNPLAIAGFVCVGALFGYAYRKWPEIVSIPLGLGDTTSAEIEYRYNRLLEDTGEVPRFPEIPGLLLDFSNALSPSLPIEYKYACAMVHCGLAISGETKLEIQPNLQPRFYLVMIGDVGRGKSWTLSEVGKYLEPRLGCKKFESIASGPALVHALAGLGDEQRHLLLQYDEFRQLLETMKITRDSRDSLAQNILSLFENNSCSNITKKDGVEIADNVHLSIIGNVPTDEYENLWIGTNAASAGLHSRLCIAIAPPGVLPSIKMQTDEAKATKLAEEIASRIDKARGTVIPVTREAQELLNLWWQDVQKYGNHSIRLDDMVKRFLLVLAVTEGRTVIDAGLMEVGILFGNYQLVQRRLYTPTDARNDVHRLEQKIMAYLEMNGAASKSIIARDINARRMGMESFQRAIKSLSDTNQIRQAGFTKKGAPTYSLNLDD